MNDDQLKPENAKQIVERYLRLDKVDFVTGAVFSNIVLAVAPDVIAAKTFFVSPNAGPAQYTGAQCSPFFFAASWPSEAYSEAAGQYVTSKGLNNVIFLAPNYAGGHDAATGFKRYYKGKLQDEMYTKLGQLDYAAELSQIRAAEAAGAVRVPAGRHGRQFHQAVRRRRHVDRHPADRAAVGLRPGHHPRGRRPDARPVQRQPLVDRHGQRRQQALRRRVREGVQAPADRLRRVGLRHRRC